VKPLIRKSHQPDKPVPIALTASRINFKLRQLELLSALAEAGTLRGAAEHIHVSQPGATRLLHELEKMLGVPLFIRNKGRMQVTAAGEVMIAHATTLQNRMVNAYTETQEAASGGSGKLRLGIFGSMDPEFLSRSLVSLRARLPRLQISITEAPQDVLVGAVRRCELDAAIGRLASNQHEGSLRYDVIYTEVFSVICSIGNPLARRRRPPSLEALLQAQWILPPPDTLLRQRFDAYFMTQIGRKPPAAIESLSLLGYVSLLQDANIIGLLSSRVARFFAQHKAFHVVIPAFGDIISPVALITRLDTAAQPATTALRHAIETSQR